LILNLEVLKIIVVFFLGPPLPRGVPGEGPDTWQQRVKVPSHRTTKLAGYPQALQQCSAGLWLGHPSHLETPGSRRRLAT
jgi:hypothetical protein